MLFLSPVFYPVSALPEKMAFLIYFNPLTFPIKQIREVELFGRMPNFIGLGAYFAMSWVVAWLGILSSEIHKEDSPTSYKDQSFRHDLS